MEELLSNPNIMALMGILVLIIIIAAVFFIKYDSLMLGGLNKALATVCLRAKCLPSEQTDRMDFLLSLVKKTGNSTLITAWEDFYREYTVVLKSEIVPDVAAYINEQRLITVPCGRRLMDRVWQALLLLGLGGALLYPALMLFVQNGQVSGQEMAFSIGISLLALAAVIFIVFIFRLADASYLEAARRSLWHFQYEAAGWFNPVTEPTMISVFVESQRRHTEAFLEAVDHLGKRLDSFEMETVVPALERSFTKAIEKNIAPALNETSAVLTELTANVAARQENGMRELARAFTDKLTALTSDNLAGLAQVTTAVSGSLTNVVTKMEQITEAMDRNQKTQETASQEARAALTEAGKVQLEVSTALASSLESVQMAKLIASEMREYAVKGMDKADAMAHQSLQLLEGNLAQVKAVQKGITELSYTLQRHTDNSIIRVSEELAAAVERYSVIFTGIEESRQKNGEEMDARIRHLVGELDQRLANYGNQMVESNARTINKLTDTVTEVSKANTRMEEKLASAVVAVSLEGSKIVEKAGLQASSLYNDILNRMDKSIDSMGDNLSASMRAAMGESVEIVEKLAVKTTEMKDLYDSYFTRIGEQSSQTLDELEFSIQKILSSFSTETAQIISKVTDNSSGALESFDKGIKELVGNMDENSRSIGLYAKEINMDVADLSNTLRGSVEEFTTQIQKGINSTFTDFDKGLGEVTLRLATILDSIRDSAEALQGALKERK